ncbi:outer membrane beta-barrel protein [Flavobacterium jejuense]|uniref:Outer membrane beta-barrel protein n=1 Tax=Flavobacterium jejuense TaxID=1544455 RepID=A0ABX0IWC6_9FLAO|nr:outer membrane beta-barrel protein [Flavobacterium jejuense]NHN27505.1 outer membrane beta-barrel protein [Flavobacterium jejuense]
MKKILLAGIVLLGLNVNAQEENKGLEGTWWIAGQVAFSSTDNGASETKSNTIVPIAGYFIAPTTTVGLGIGVINSTTDTGSVTVAESNTFIVQPLVRKYWGLGGKFFMYGQASLPMTFGKDKITDDKTTSIGVDIAPGFDFLVNSWMTVETSFSLLNITSSTLKPSSGDSTNSFNFNANPFDLNPGSRSIGGLRVGVKFLF